MKIDTYTIKARLMPAFLVLLPIGLALAAWFPTELFTGWRSAMTIAGYCGVLVLLSEFGRDLGKKKEAQLFKLWSGKPTTRMLRHRHSPLDAVTLARYHGVIGKLIGATLPNREAEKADQKSADALYESGVKLLLEKTRDSNRFPLLLKENTSYGFRRNLWGMKPAAIGICCLSLIATLVPVCLALFDDKTLPPLPVALAIGIIVLLVWWVLRVNPDWIRIPGDGYAQRLLAACDSLSEGKPL